MACPPFRAAAPRISTPKCWAANCAKWWPAFEPRLKRDTIRVTVDTGSKEGLKVKIEGVLMLSPVPERLRLSTTIDLDNGHAATRIEDA